MVILASLPGHNLFSALPTTAPTTHNRRHHHHPPPIPVPKYPPPKPKSHPPKPKPSPKPQHPHPFTRIPHTRTKYYKPVSPSGDQIITDDDRAVIIGQSGVSYLLPGAPFEFQFSYSEIPKAQPVAIREPAFLPFAPPSMPRPWTGKAPLKKKKDKKKIPLFEPFNKPDSEVNGVKRVEMPGPYKLGDFQKESRSREEILGDPLSRAEIKKLVQPLVSDNRQVNLGRDGLTHNMLELIHSHWKRQPVCKVKCKGVPTVDMDNICRCLEEKAGGRVIHRAGGVVYLFRGRNYDYSTRPKYPLMLWKPAAPVYPKLIQDAPGGLTKQEADELRQKGKKLLPICKLAKNGVYVDLVNDVRHAFEGSILAKVNCQGLEPSDYKKIGAKLMELVPCVLLSFDDEQILMWRGHDWKSMYPETPTLLPSCSAALDDSGMNGGRADHDEINFMFPPGGSFGLHIYLTGGQALSFPRLLDIPGYGRKSDDGSREPTTIKTISSPRMMSLWKRAIESNKAFLLDETDLGPDALLEKVEAFEGMTQAAEHSYPARLTVLVLIAAHQNTYDTPKRVRIFKTLGGQLVMDADTTDPSYWLNWRFLICALFVLGCMAFASLLIWKYERANKSEDGRREPRQAQAGVLYKDELWRTCLKGVHPAWLLAFRILAFIVLLAFIIGNAIADGLAIFLYYTQLTFTLTTIYFALASAFSFYGCWHDRGRGCRLKGVSQSFDVEQVYYAFPRVGSSENMLKSLCNHEEINVRQIAGFVGYLFQIMYQVSAGAVVLTDVVFWFIMYPFLTAEDLRLHFFNVCMHSVNILILGDALLNCMFCLTALKHAFLALGAYSGYSSLTECLLLQKFPMFRIAYFMLWTALAIPIHGIVNSIFSPMVHTSGFAALPVLWLLCIGSEVEASVAFKIFSRLLPSYEMKTKSLSSPQVIINIYSYPANLQLKTSMQG
ncbi:LOW QUALITY PROTEIN: hypothetical protein Cgig2_024604 [Carnegiea gigantea]|uniref:CRM domain-containing protein n=1 Tax=Carnegiea gigantea TaxID=171969 RepID=A0A9Q1K7W5_9CARY|nr:LOW QUALITY PROTEIN: hypothetical protein Cgig2_024604 [Carnegiea gigantea]